MCWLRDLWLRNLMSAKSSDYFANSCHIAFQRITIFSRINHRLFVFQVLLEDLEKLIDSDYHGQIKPEVETAIQLKWGKILGDEYDIVVSVLVG